MQLKSSFYGVNCLLERAGPFIRDSFKPSPELLSLVKEHAHILIIGAGGLGCELLKDVALMGFSKIDIIDMDTIDLSNLNRQFLFTDADIGKPKAEVAARLVNERVKTCQITPYFKKIQDFDEDFYRKYNVVVCGLDSLSARRWMNSMLASLVKYDEATEKPILESVIPMVDGGTEGFKGNIIVILYGLTGCLECSLDLYPPQVNYPLCTIAHNPRLPEHCVEYVKVIEWEKMKPFGNKPIDTDDSDHLNWVFERSEVRAKEFNIPNVNMRLVKGVLKRIIPAVASTNAVIAAACATEVFKLVTFSYPYLDNYMNFSDIEGVYTYSFQIWKKDDCHVCSRKMKFLEVKANTKLEDLIKTLQESPDLQLKSPSITTVTSEGKNKTLYISSGVLAETLKGNLSKELSELEIVNGQILLIGDESLKKPISITIKFT